MQVDEFQTREERIEMLENNPMYDTLRHRELEVIRWGLEETCEYTEKFLEYIEEHGEIGEDVPDCLAEDQYHLQRCFMILEMVEELAKYREQTDIEFSLSTEEPVAEALESTSTQCSSSEEEHE